MSRSAITGAGIPMPSQLWRRRCPIPATGRLSLSLGVLGLNGVTAYFALLELGQPRLAILGRLPRGGRVGFAVRKRLIRLVWAAQN
jgi:hypothetical protein